MPALLAVQVVWAPLSAPAAGICTIFLFIAPPVLTIVYFECVRLFGRMSSRRGI